MHDSRKIILGSRSPRRRELLAHIVPPERIVVLPPRSSEEAGFDGLYDWPSIEARLRQIARTKCDNVLEQVNATQRNNPASGGREPPGQLHSTTRAQNHGAHAPRSPYACVVTADTVILGVSDGDQFNVLGQPPERDNWADVVRKWFREYYFARPHYALTALCVATPDGRRAERVVQSEVTFRGDGEQWLDWYLSTGEPRGKAGGYAIQDAGSLFVEKVEGSLSNVVGLPLVELLELFQKLGVDRT